MAPIALEPEDHSRDASFAKTLHGKSALEKGGFRSMIGKDAAAQKAAIDEYFKHWDNKEADVETQEIRDVIAPFRHRSRPLPDNSFYTGAKSTICHPYTALL